MTNVDFKRGEPICALCAWFIDPNQKDNPIIDGVVQVRSKPKGICRRYPPKDGKQETVSYFDKCGEYTEN